MVLEEAEKIRDRTFVLKCNLTSYLTSRHQITSDKMSLPQWAPLDVRFEINGLIWECGMT